MARMIPDLPVDELDPHNLRHFNGDISERAVYRALKEQLPDTWVVRYNYVFCYHQAGRLCPDGQADFIIASPNQGLMFLEVKGAAGMEIRQGQCYWLREDGSLGNPTDSPFAQAQANKHSVVGILRRSCFGGAPFPGRFGHMVVFPRAKGRVPTSHETDVVVCHDGMADLLKRVDATFNLFGDPNIAASFNQQRFLLVVGQLEENTRFVPVTAADAEEDSRKIEALTEQQWMAFQGILGNRRVSVNGVAGSGKTVLALWAAKRFAKDGKRVLFMCFNKLLKSWIDITYPPRTRGFDVETFHSFTSRECRVAGRPFQIQNTGDWQNSAPNALLDAIDARGDNAKYDVVIVDEAQDFYPQWFTPVEFILRGDESRLLVFSDPRQRLYGVNPVKIQNMTRYELVQNCRNTRNISGFCANVVQSPIACFDRSPDGVPPAILDAIPNVEGRRTAVQRVVREWLAEGFTPSQIAILSPWADGNPASSLVGLTTVYGQQVCAGEDGLARWRNGACILGETVKAFKGLEADCLIITDIPAVGTTGFDQPDLYVAASRAKQRLHLVPSDQASEAELRAYCDHTERSSG